VPAFNDHVKKLAQSLMNQTETWANPRQLSDGLKSRKKIARAGVEVFAYVETDSVRKRGARS
jgi:hypothetical protein